MHPLCEGINRDLLERLQLPVPDQERSSYSLVLVERLIRVMSQAAQPGNERTLTIQWRQSVAVRAVISNKEQMFCVCVQKAKCAWRRWSWAACYWSSRYCLAASASSRTFTWPVWRFVRLYYCTHPATLKSVGRRVRSGQLDMLTVNSWSSVHLICRCMLENRTHGLENIFERRKKQILSFISECLLYFIHKCVML